MSSRAPHSIRTRMMLLVAFFSIPILLIGFVMTLQARQTSQQVGEMLAQSAAASKAVQKALAYVSQGNSQVYSAMVEDRPSEGSRSETQRHLFEDANFRFNLLIKALAWGTESSVFRRDDGGKLYNEWLRLDWQNTIGTVNTSDAIRHFAGLTDIYHSAFSKYTVRAMDALDRSDRPAALAALEKAEKFRALVDGTLSGLLDAIDQDARDRRSAMLQIQARRTHSLSILAIGLFFLVVLFSWFFVQRDILRPLKDLSGQLQRIGSGDLSVKARVSSRDEIGALADSFNAMTEKLKNLYTSLDSKVAERTRELDDARLAALNMMQDAENAREKAELTAESLQREMSERKKLESQLIQSQKMETVGTLAGGIAHDLNNQLTPVKGYIDVILSQTPPSDPNHELLREANVSVERCAEVVARLMNFSRPSKQERSILSTQKLFQELKGLLNKFLPATIRVEVLCPEDIYPLQGDETELLTVFMNLAANARDAMPEGGHLAVEAKNVNLDPTTVKPGLHEGAYALISVHDTGAGIPPEVLGRIFEPFFTTKRKGQGTGLGLAMVFKNIKESGGWVEVSSQVGKGTTFQVYLPALPGAKPREVSSSRLDLEALVGNKEMILFADDEETIRKMGKILLEKLGYRVWLCADGQEAVSVYRDNRSTIHAVVLDMTMPNMTGKQALLKILEINPSAKVILASGYTVEGSAQELIALGARDFLNKPYTIVPLAKSLKSVLSL